MTDVPRPETAAPATKPAFEIGLYSFGDLTPDPHSGLAPTAAEKLKDVLAAAKLADEAGLDVFGVGEHHRLDFAISSTATVLGAIAAATREIRLTSAVTVLSSADPVRVFEDFATLDLISGGRAEIIAGRGAFIESFPLFGYDLDDYDELFAEKLALLMELRDAPRLSWSGRLRPPLHDAEIAPRPIQARLPIWVGLGGTPQSAIRAGALGLPMALALIGGTPDRFAPLLRLYRRAGAENWHKPHELQIAINSHLFVAPTSQGARDVFHPHYAHYFRNFLPGGKGAGPLIDKDAFAELASPQGALFVGSPQEIIDKMLYEHRLFGHSRFLAHYDIGGLPFREVARSIELLATEVAPVLRREIGAPAG